MDGTRSHGMEEMTEVEKEETQQLGVRKGRTQPRRSGRLSLTGLSFNDACPRPPGPLSLTWYTLHSLVSFSKWEHCHLLEGEPEGPSSTQWYGNGVTAPGNARELLSKR